MRAADEIKKLTNGKYVVEVFPASSLDDDGQINRVLPPGTVDIIMAATRDGNLFKPPVSTLSTLGRHRHEVMRAHLLHCSFWEVCES